MPKVIHYRNKCIGCNSCVEQAPARWKMSEEDGKSDLLGGEEKRGVFVVDVSEAEREENERAAKDCPVKIIRVEN